jgi:hypothetical protein
MNRPRVAVLLTALVLATALAGCGGSGSPGAAHASPTRAVRGTAHAPTLAQMRRDLAGLPAWQRKFMLKQWEIMRSSERRGCPTNGQLRKLTLRLDAITAGKARNAVFVLGCRATERGS